MVQMKLVNSIKNKNYQFNLNNITRSNIWNWSFLLRCFNCPLIQYLQHTETQLKFTYNSLFTDPKTSFMTKKDEMHPNYKYPIIQINPFTAFSQKSNKLSTKQRKKKSCN